MPCLPNCLAAFLLLTASTGSKFPDNRRFLGACRIPQFDLCKSHVRVTSCLENSNPN